ncbi:RHS repeat-associated core domain-containing protein [Tenacibaculum sp. 190524A05c]|uniref:RHS repeat-associated core domain-containing protein n=1 Tax=Tenacibaculum platacis TaxID=3137852 RepID=A0ABP1EKR7_9FLAO
MKNLINTIVIKVICLLSVLQISSQELIWKSSNNFIVKSQILSTESKKPTGDSYLISESVLDLNTTGSFSISGFQIGGRSITSKSSIGDFGIYLTSESEYSLEAIESASYAIVYDQEKNRIVFTSPNGEIAVINRVSLASSDVFTLEKTDSNKVRLTYNKNSYLVTDNFLEDLRIVVRSQAADFSFLPSSRGFFIAADSDYVGVTDTDKNWVWSRTFDNTGKVTSTGINYFDNLGKATQSQTRDFKTNKNWATEVRYDAQGRPTLETLSAPINTNQSFSFKEDFIQKSNGTTYSNADYETDPEFPSEVGSQVGSLGYYYSDNNTSEPLQDIAEGRPYSKTVYDELNPGNVRAVVGGKTMNLSNQGSTLLNRFPQGYSYTMPAAQEMQYVFGKDYFPSKIGKFGAIINTKFTKTVAIDVNGVETVVFSDGDRVLATGRSGGTTLYEVVSVIGEQGFIDVHIPKGVAEFSFFGNIGSIYNIRTGREVTQAEVAGGNIYRIETSIASQNNVPYTFINSNHRFEASSGASGIRYKVNYYEFAVNYYDDAGRLVKSTQPIGFDINAFDLSTGSPNHGMVTTYNYNALGELQSTTSPDEGSAAFIYREDGQIRFSRSTKQEELGEFSYTHYDDKARPIESGICEDENPYFALKPNPTAQQKYQINSELCSEQVFTQYDVNDHKGLWLVLYGGSTNLPQNYRKQQFLAGNVSKTWTENPSTSTTWYSYDIYGRVTWVVQDIDGLGLKTIDYEYDDGTGQVNRVIYQRDEANETFIHRYVYNEFGQLITVETSRDGNNYVEHARYSYYETGALKRTEIAEGLQGLDYVYTLNGQLKAINHPGLSSDGDPGDDQNDAFGLIIDYNRKDYTRANTGITKTFSGTDQYNGNIKGYRWATLGLQNASKKGYLFDYNEKNWLTSASFKSIVPSAFNTDIYHGNDAGDYNVYNLSYDANGNIGRLDRNKDSHNGINAMDKLKYHYYDNGNQLSYVQDNSGNADDVGDIKTQLPNNYVYNSIGQLIENKQDEIQYEYYTNGLVKSVRTTDPNSDRGVYFTYNDRGHRVGKKSLNGNGGGSQTYYVRDASGQVLGIYSTEIGTNPHYSIQYPVYGASRLGMATQGNTFKYEIADHLGNVRAVIMKDGSVPPILDEQFTGNTVPTSITSSNNVTTSISSVPFSEIPTGTQNKQLKIAVTGTSNNHVKIPFQTESGHTYSIKFYTGLFETSKALTYYVSTEVSSETLFKKRRAEQSGIKTFTYKANTTGQQYLIFELETDGFADQNITNNYYLDNIRVNDVTTENAPVMLAYKDYYPFGMPMPNRNVEGEYPYAFQGQEKDQETGMEAFELRLWDARIGRWLTTDPYGQFQSPYLGMGNNPISQIDPDGGYSLPFGIGKAIADAVWDYTFNQNIVLDQVDLYGKGSENLNFSSFSFDPELQNSIDQAKYNILGGINSFVSNSTFGLGRIDPSRIDESYRESYINGQQVGDAASIVVGLLEATTGGVVYYGGYILAVPSYGISVPLSETIGTTLIAHGLGTTASGIFNLTKSFGKKGHKKGGGSLDDLYSGKTADEIISSFRKGSVRDVFPGGLLTKTWEEIKAGASAGKKNYRTAKKLLTDGRFKK